MVQHNYSRAGLVERSERNPKLQNGNSSNMPQKDTVSRYIFNGEEDQSNEPVIEEEVNISAQHLSKHGLPTTALNKDLSGPSHLNTNNLNINSSESEQKPSR